MQLLLVWCLWVGCPDPPPPAPIAEVAPRAIVSAPVAPQTPANVEQWRGLVAAYFPASEVDRALCIMGFESGGDPAAYNASTATGLMQVKSFWAESFGYSPGDLFDPAINLAVAAGIQASGGWTHWSPYNRGECH